MGNFQRKFTLFTAIATGRSEKSPGILSYGD